MLTFTLSFDRSALKMLLQAFRSRDTCEIEAKFIHNRIQFVEKNISELNNVLSQYSHKAGSIRDKTDELSKVVSNYAATESINKTLSTGLEHFADSLQTLCDHSDKRVESLNSKVVAELAKYKEVCKHAKEEIKDIYSAREKELTRKKQLYRIKERNPRNRQQIIQAETELVKATAKVSKSIHNLEEKTTVFEKQKLHDLKSTLMDFIAIEVAYHVHSLEVLTKAYNEVESINEQSDLEQFKKSLRLPDQMPAEPSRSSFFNSGSRFGSLGAIFSSKQTRSLRKSNEKLSKSEENLDSAKNGLSEDESDESPPSDISDEIHVSSSDDDNDKRVAVVAKQRK